MSPQAREIKAKKKKPNETTSNYKVFAQRRKLEKMKTPPSESDKGLVSKRY